MKFWLILLVTFFLIRYVLPIVARALLGGFVRQQVRRAQEQGGAPFGGPFGPGAGPQQAPPTRPGEVRVDYVPPTSGPAPDKKEFKGGEYVDFEEV